MLPYLASLIAVGCEITRIQVAVFYMDIHVAVIIAWQVDVSVFLVQVCGELRRHLDIIIDRHGLIIRIAIHLLLYRSDR